MWIYEGLAFGLPENHSQPTTTILAIVTARAPRGAPTQSLESLRFHKRQLTALNLSTFKPIPNEPYPSQSSKQFKP